MGAEDARRHLADGDSPIPLQHIRGHERRTEQARLRGWCVDGALPGRGLRPVSVEVSVDALPVAAALADVARADLVPAGVAPNPEHGFTVVLPAKAAAALRGAGRHAVGVQAVGTPGTATPFRVGSAAFCGGAPC